jgi:hypothetical protein
MDKLRERIERAGAWNPIAELELKAFWKHCIEAIKGTALREAVVRFLAEAVPVHFFLEAAGGKQHPAWQNGRFGMLRNTTECCILLPFMAQYEPGMLDAEKKPVPQLVDVALAATIVSDTFKFDADGRKTGPDHGRVAGKAWREFAEKLGTLPALVIEKVGTASDWHYGVYTPGYVPGLPLTPETWLVHRLDAFFAQRSLEQLYHPKGFIE